jgi:hypothetical protein
MKKHSLIILFLILTVFLYSCKKDNTPKDYSVFIKEKTWSGMFTYTGKKPEYYSIHFHANNNLTWSELLGDYPGQWLINGKQLVMTFPGISAEIKADISDDNKLLNFVDNTGNFEVQTGELVVNPNLPLENTVWTGTIRNAVPFQIRLLPASKIELKVEYTTDGPYPYLRSVSGAVIRSIIGSFHFFGVVTSANEMKGSHYSYNNTWQVTKQ